MKDALKQIIVWILHILKVPYEFVSEDNLEDLYINNSIFDHTVLEKFCEAFADNDACILDERYLFVRYAYDVIQQYTPHGFESKEDFLRAVAARMYNQSFGFQMWMVGKYIIMPRRYGDEVYGSLIQVLDSFHVTLPDDVVPH